MKINDLDNMVRKTITRICLMMRLSNSSSYFRKNNSSNPIGDALKTCLPFIQRIMQDVRDNIKSNENGVITVMIREAAIVASVNPSELHNLEINVLSNNEALVKKK